MIEPVNQVRVGEDTRLFILDQSSIVPTGPQPERDLKQFLGTVVSHVMVEVSGKPEVLRLDGRIGSHNIPTDAAVGQMIQSGKAPGEVVWRVERRRRGRYDPQVARDTRDDRNDEAGIQPGCTLSTASERVTNIVAVAGRSRRIVGKEDEVQFRAFENPTEVLVVLRCEKPGITAWMTPRRMTVGYIPCNQKPAQVNWTPMCRHRDLSVRCWTDCSRPPRIGLNSVPLRDSANNVYVHARQKTGRIRLS